MNRPINRHHPILRPWSVFASFRDCDSGSRLRLKLFESRPGFAQDGADEFVGDLKGEGDIGELLELELLLQGEEGGVRGGRVLMVVVEDVLRLLGMVGGGVVCVLVSPSPFSSSPSSSSPSSVKRDRSVRSVGV